MITTEDIHNVYCTYRKNLNRAAALERALYRTSDRTEWQGCLLERARERQRMFLENEALLEVYIRPILREEEPITEELIVALATEVCNMMILGKDDYMMTLEVAEFIEPYLEGRGRALEHIRVLRTLGYLYGCLTQHEYLHKAIWYLSRIRRYRRLFFETKDREIGNQIFHAYLIHGTSVARCSDITVGETLRTMDEAIAFFQDPRVQKLQLESGRDTEQYVEHFIYQVVSARCLLLDTVLPLDEGYQKLYSYIEKLYAKRVADLDEPYDMEDEIFCSYHKLRYLLGLCPASECAQAYHRYHVYNWNSERSMEQSYVFIDNSRVFHLMMRHLPDMLHLHKLAYAHQPELVRSYAAGFLDDFAGFLQRVPKEKSEMFISSQLYANLIKTLQELPEGMDEFRLLTEILIERDLDMMIHSHMVGIIAVKLFELLYDKRPELLIGCRGTSCLSDVKAQHDDLRRFINRAGLMHDIGKSDISFITKMQIRSLNCLEFYNIRQHPRLGEELIKRSAKFQEYAPVALGHHRFWNEQGGYPKEYSRKDCADAVLVDLIQIADCIDAVTDHVGRTYAKTKNFDDLLTELERGMGKQYNPDIVTLLLESESAKKELLFLTAEGRMQICYEIYRNFLEDDAEKKHRVHADMER